MTTTAPKADPQPLREFLRLGSLSLATAAALLLVGYLPTQNLGGQTAIIGMFVGVAIALLGTLAGLAPPLLALNTNPQQRQQALLLGMGARFVLTLIILLAVLLGSPVDRAAAALWTALAYLVLLAIDVAALVNLLNRVARNSA